MYSNDKNALLKYFYLIDMERLAEKVNERLNKSNSTEPDNIFQIMFSEISKTCNPYLEFIYSASSFNHTDSYGTYPSVTRFFDEILKNHCILHGFQSAVKEDSDGTVKISGANDSQLRHGYFSTGHFKDKPAPASDGNRHDKDKSALTASDNAPDKTISQKYNEYKHRFHKYPDSYSYCVLKKSDTGSCKDFPIVQSYDGNWGCFIFTNHHVLTLDKNVSNHNSAILKNYEKLLKDSVQWCKINELLPEDKILFEAAMERIYGFRFFCYAAKLLNMIHTDSLSLSNNNVTYKDLESSALLNIIQQAAQLPVVYNRFVFLEHAICSVVRSKYLKDLEYQEKPVSLFSKTSRESAPPLLLITSGFEQIRKYLQKLKRIAIPLLNNVWDSLTDKLNQGNNRFSINIDTYRTYIKKNHSSIAQDYPHYFKSEEPDSLSHAEQSKDTYDPWQNFSFKDALPSKFERDSFTSLLFGYFDANRFPIRQTDLCHLLTPHPDIAEPEKHTVELNFYKYHFENILSFAENISPSIESNASHPSDKG